MRQRQRGSPDLRTRIQDVLEVGSPDLIPRKKKRKQAPTQQTPTKALKVDRGKAVLDEFFSEDEEEEERPQVEGALTWVVPGAVNYSVDQIAKLMSEIPTNEDWERMDDLGLVSTFKEVGSLWGQVMLSTAVCL